MLARRGGNDISNRVQPEPNQRHHAALVMGVAALGPNVCSISRAWSVRKSNGNARSSTRNNRSAARRWPPRCDAHTDLGRDTSFFARAISTIDSSRSISAAATLRPSADSR